MGGGDDAASGDGLRRHHFHVPDWHAPNGRALFALEVAESIAFLTRVWNAHDL